jgi:hypothetical protein
MAQVFRELKRAGDIRISDQRQWLSRREECGADRVCLLTSYREWPGFESIAHGLGPSFERVGTGRRDPASLYLMPIHGNWHYFSLIALHQQTADPGSTNTGVYGGLIELKNGVGTYDEGPQDYSCRFRMVRARHGGWSLEEFGETAKCGGLNVFVSGEYRPVKRRRN